MSLVWNNIALFQTLLDKLFAHEMFALEAFCVAISDIFGRRCRGGLDLWALICGS